MLIIQYQNRCTPSRGGRGRGRGRGSGQFHPSIAIISEWLPIVLVGLLHIIRMLILLHNTNRGPASTNAPSNLASCPSPARLQWVHSLSMYGINQVFIQSNPTWQHQMKKAKFRKGKKSKGRSGKTSTTPGEQDWKQRKATFLQTLYKKRYRAWHESQTRTTRHPHWAKNNEQPRLRTWPKLTERRSSTPRQLRLNKRIEQLSHPKMQKSILKVIESEFSKNSGTSSSSRRVGVGDPFGWNLN